MLKKIIEITEDVRKKRGRIYVFPGSVAGYSVYSTIRERLYKNVCCVDNTFYEYSDDCICLDQALDMFEDNDIILLATERTEIIGALRRELLLKGISETRVCNLYGRILEYKNNDLRLRHLVYTAEEIYRNQVKGSVAEAGVYRGEFAKHINSLFPDRILYLFDSFEGFRTDDFKKSKDNINQYEAWMNLLKDTSESIVIDKMIYKDKIVMKKGYIPETLTNLEDTFAFVNLDMDIYKPTYESLLWFWDRLNPGGYIFVHDFGVWDGIREAVERFCAERKTGYLRLADNHSVAIVKSIAWEKQTVSEGIC